MPSLHYHLSRLGPAVWLAALFTLSLSSPAELWGQPHDTEDKISQAATPNKHPSDPKVHQAAVPIALTSPSIFLPAGRILGLGIPLSKLPSWLKTQSLAAFFYVAAAGYSAAWLRKSPNLEKLIWQSELADSLSTGPAHDSTGASVERGAQLAKPEILPPTGGPEEPKVGVPFKTDRQAEPSLVRKKAHSKITMDLFLATFGTLPTDQIQSRAAALQMDGQPALSAEQLSVVSAYNIWQFIEDLRPHQQKLFFHQLMTQKPNAAHQTSNRLISAFQSHLDRIVTTSKLSAKAKKPSVSTAEKPPPIPFAELEETFDDMDADEVFTRLRRAPMFSHQDLRKKSNWLTALKNYIAELPPVKRHMFYVAGLGLSPGTTLKSIAIEWQARPGSVQRIKGTLATKIQRVLLEEDTTQHTKHKLARLEAQFQAMPATEVFTRLDRTDMFDVPATTTDPDIRMARHQILKDQLAESDSFKRHLFYSYFLGMDQTTPEEIANGWGVSKSSAKLYRDFLTSKIGAIIQAGSNSLRILSFDQLEARFEKMEDSKILSRLQRSPVFRKSLLQRILFTKEGISDLKDHLASSLEVRRHVFYSMILMLDGHSLEEIAQKWDVTYGGAWYHKDSLVKTIETIFSTPELKSLDDSAETLATLETKFLGMDNTEVARRLEQSGMLMDCDLKKCPLTEQKLQDLQDYLLKSRPEARRIFYSLFLQMEKTLLKHLSGQMNIKYRLAWNTQFRLRSEITSLLQNEGSWVELPLSLEQMDAEFKAIDNEKLLSRLQSSALLASTSQQDHQLTANDLTRFRGAILRSAPIRRHVLYSLFLKMNNHLPGDVAERWQVAPLAVQYHVGHLSNFISDMFRATDKERLTHSFDELEEMFIAMQPTEVMDRLRKVDAFQGIEISYEDYGVLRLSLASDNILRRHIFYSHFLMMDSSTLNEIASIWHYSYSSAWYHKHSLQANLSRLFKEQRSPKVHRSFEELEADFLAMAPSQVLSSLHHTTHLGDLFDVDQQLTKMNYQVFREMLLDDKPLKRYIFYVFFLGMDDISLKEIAALWQVKYSQAWHDKNHIHRKITKIFELNQPPLHYKRTFEVMDADFWKMPPSTIWERLSRSEQLQEANLVFSDAHYKAFTKYITQISPIRRHVLYSLVLKMDMSNKGSIARQWNISDGGVRYHENQLVAEIIEVFNKTDPNHSQPSFEELDAEFLTMSPSEALLRLRSFADLPKELTKELTEESYPELRDYIVKSLPIKRHVFFNRFLRMDNRSPINLAVMYNVGRTTISYHAQHIQKTMTKIFDPSPPQPR